MSVKRTYGSRKTTQGSVPLQSAGKTETSTLTKRKRLTSEVLTSSISQNVPQAIKRQKISTKSRSRAYSKQKTLTQLHFVTDQSTLRTCVLCQLSYTKGAPEDELLHRAHCARVQRGMEWGKEEERESAKAGIVQIDSQVRLRNGKRGRIISCPAICSGKIGSKINTLLETINLSLSSPPLTQECLRNSKIYLFLLPQTSMSSNSNREKIVGCVIAQQISHAMAIASVDDITTTQDSMQLVTVDSSTGLFCHPKRLPTPMGVPRLFVPSTFRRQGIASVLLTAAAATLIHGCPLNAREGQVAFTQPTGDGKALMTKWGEGGIRIYEE